MAATRVFILLLSASALLISQQKGVILDSVVWAAELALKHGTVFRDRLKRGTEGPEMVVIPAAPALESRDAAPAAPTLGAGTK